MEDKIINSLLDTDLYKFTMAQAVLHQFPGAYAKYRFVCRDDVKLGFLVNKVNAELDHLCTLMFKDDELEYLKGLRFIKPDFVEFLRNFKLNRKFINAVDQDGQLEIFIYGPWLQTIWFEVPVLSIVNELYFESKKLKDANEIGDEKLAEKIIQIEKADASFKFVDFGARRRYSRDWHHNVLKTFKEEVPNHFIGTSDVLFAKQLGIKAVGTMAHEWICAGQNLGPRLRDSQKFMLQKWADEYRGDLGIALSDTLGFNAFLNDFDMYFAKLFDGCRQDSGDPIEWLNKMIAHYKALGMDPTTKIAVFSDGLTIPKAIEIWKVANGKIKTTFGIGTNLTNDVGAKPLNIVIKMTEINDHPVAKISDTPGKTICKDEAYMAYLKTQFGIR